MKTIQLVVVLFFAVISTVGAQEDAIAKYFNQYMEDQKFTSVFISPKMFEMMADLDVNDPDYQQFKGLMKDIKGLRILTTEQTPQKYYEEAMSKINTKEYELLMTVRDEGENVRFMTKHDAAGKISELLMLVGSADEFVLLSFIGNIDLSKISKLSSKMDVKGLENLDKLDKKQ